MNRPVLVTGATGFIGRHLVVRLRAEGRPVRIVARRAAAAAELANAGAEVIVGDLLDPAVVSQATAGVAGVFNLAGQLFAQGIDVSVFKRLHVDATVALLEGCAQSAPPEFFLHCSTTGVHGPTGERPAREDDPGHPQNAYEQTKVDGERAAIGTARRLGLPLVIARPGLVYGPGDLHLLGLYRAIQGGYYRVIGPGRNHQHPIFIDDAIEGLRLCISRGGTDGRAFHLVGSRAVTMRELSDAIGAAVGRPVPRGHIPVALAALAGAAFECLPVPRRFLPLTRSRVKFLQQNREYDGERARTELGFRPMIDLADGLRRTVAWYRAHALL